MKRGLTALLVCLLALTAGSAMADKTGYTLPAIDMCTLQNNPDRTPTVHEDAALHDAIPGQSPVTGLPWTGDYLPMLVQIGNEVGTVKVNGHNVKTAGVGKYAPWGLQYADIVYVCDFSSSSLIRSNFLFTVLLTVSPLTVKGFNAILK